jgi:hypothetical protein
MSKTVYEKFGFNLNEVYIQQRAEIYINKYPADIFTEWDYISEQYLVYSCYDHDIDNPKNFKNKNFLYMIIKNEDKANSKLLNLIKPNTIELIKYWIRKIFKTL